MLAYRNIEAANIEVPVSDQTMTLQQVQRKQRRLRRVLGTGCQRLASQVGRVLNVAVAVHDHMRDAVTVGISHG